MKPAPSIHLPAKNRTLAMMGLESIGEAVMALPALRELRRHHPEVRRVLVGPPPLVKFLLAMGEVEDVIPLDHSLGWRESSGCLRLWREIRKKKARVFLCLRSSIPTRLCASASGARHRIGYIRGFRSPFLNRNVRLPKELQRFHHAWFYLHLLYESGLSPINYLRDPDFRPDNRLRLAPEQVRLAGETLRALGVDPMMPFLGLYAGGAGNSAGRWPPERYAAFIRQLREDFSFTVILVGTRSDAEIAGQLASEIGPNDVCNACGRLTLAETAAVVATCRLFIGSDGGLQHLAAAFQVPQIALFGPNDPVVTGPLSTRAVSLRKNLCGPCFVSDCPIDRRCMKAITVQEVVNRARDLLKKEYRSH